MKQSEIQARVARLECMTKRLMTTTLAGDYCSAFKGAGLEFDQLREYQLGDDIRTIDWNSVAKTDRLMVKRFIQERDRTMIIALDLSSSMYFSSTSLKRKEIAEQLAAALAWIGHASKDRIGFVGFSDKIEFWIPPARGNSQIQKILEALCQPTKPKTQTLFTPVLEFLIQLKKKHAIVFMISDWIELQERDKRLLKIIKYEYDFIAFRILDRLETESSLEGFFIAQDIETEEEEFIAADDFTSQYTQRLAQQDLFFKNHAIELMTYKTDQPWFNQLLYFFHKRTRRLV